jgi:CRP/FNR family cyclic AMP-dependent transcriptional regulator
MASAAETPPRAELLAQLESLGDAAKFADQILALIPKCRLLENFSSGEVRLLAHFMDAYRADVGVEIMREGESGDFMMLLIEGKVEVQKRDRLNEPRPIAEVDAGRTLGEMSMIDGEPRFASCMAIEPALIAVLDRERLARIIVEQPMLGAKILMELVLMLSQRLRATTERLLGLLDEGSRESVGSL